MNKATKHPKTPNVVTEQDQGRCALAPCSAEMEIADTHEMLAQMCCDNGDREMAQQHMTVATTIRKLAAALVDANDLCRSASEIAKRKGKATRWPAFRDCLSESLERQHRVMYPPNVAHQRPRATGARHETEWSSRGSLDAPCYAPFLFLKRENASLPASQR
jgi:hypothetical protein